MTNKSYTSTISIGVTTNDIQRAESDPSRCPITRAIARTLKESIYDVDINYNHVYIWDEWDNPSQVYIFSDGVKEHVIGWETSLEQSEPYSISPFEFKLIKRK